MKLEALASKPKLTAITIDDEKIVENYGEPLEFYIYDRQPMDVFMKLAALEGEHSVGDITTLAGEMIMDEKGKKILTDGNVLPVDVMLKVVEATVTRLGNSVAQTSETSAQS